MAIYRWLLVVLVAASFAISPLQAAARTLVFLGDSLTAGYGLPEEQSYPSLINEMARADKLDWKFVNAGVSGDTTKGGLERVNWILRSSPTVVVVALGANDGLRGLDLSATKNNLDSIVRTLKNAGVRVILAGMQLPINYGPAYRLKFSRIFPSLSKKWSIPLYPFLLEGSAGKPELNLADGIHPNEKGHRVVAQNFYKFLKPFLK